MAVADVVQPPMAADVVQRLWEQIEPIVYITRDQFVRGLVEWDIEPVEIGGQLAFAVLTRGSELHFASFDTGHPISRAMIRERMAPLFERHGFVTTRTPKNEARQHRINRLLGFAVSGEDEFFVHYRIEKCQ